jgi:hypothetical protein
MNEYELKRIQNIERNNQYLKSLGLIGDGKKDVKQKRKKQESSSSSVERPQRKKRNFETIIQKESKKIIILSSIKINIKSINSLLSMKQFPFAETKTEAMQKLADFKSHFKFSKLSGIQQFQNAIILFINIDGETYDNVVLDDSKRLIQWFAQSRQSLDSPVISRMMSGDCDVLLLVRNVGEPYSFIGRVSIESCIDPEARPLAFRLRLLDRSLGNTQD